MLITFDKRNEEEKITTVEGLRNYILEKNNGLEKFSEEDKAKKDAQIINKLKAGKKLTSDELRYLRKTNPIMYAHAMRVQVMAKAVEEQLKHAKSKEEANRIVSGTISGISKDDPDKEYIVAAVNRISKEMHQSPAYNRLPNTDADVQKVREKQLGSCFEDAEEEDDDNKDGFDLSNWSPLQEVIDAMPKFVANV